MEHQKFFAQITVRNDETGEIKDMALDLVVPYRMRGQYLVGHWYEMDETPVSGNFVPLEVWGFKGIDNIITALDKTVRACTPILEERSKIYAHNVKVLSRNKDKIKEALNGN